MLHFARAERIGQEGVLRILTPHFDQFDGLNIIEILHCFSREEEIESSIQLNSRFVMIHSLEGWGQREREKEKADLKSSLT